MPLAHRTKLLASAARLAERLRERGRALPGRAGGGSSAGGEVYAAEAQVRSTSLTDSNLIGHLP